KKLSSGTVRLQAELAPLALLSASRLSTPRAANTVPGRCLVLGMGLDSRFGPPTPAPSAGDGSTATTEILVSAQFHSERPRLHARLREHSDRDDQKNQQPKTSQRGVKLCYAIRAVRAGVPS